MKATSFVAAALLAAGTSARAQEPAAAPPMTFLRPVTFPLLAPVAPVDPVSDAQPAPQTAPPSASRAADRRDDIKMLEAVFTTAVKNGADKLALQMQTVDPGSLFVTGTGRTRGFDLQGYGVFFDVDVPMMRQSVLWSARQLTQQDARVQLESNIASLPAGPLREYAVRELRRLQQQQGMRQPGVASPTQIANPGVVTGQVAESTTAAALPAPALDPRDPNELYTEAIKTSLVDAMLKYSVGLSLGADEWLTVAARDAEGPLAPGVANDASTIILRIRGVDLAAFHAGKLTRDEVMKKVEVKEF